MKIIVCSPDGNINFFDSNLRFAKRYISTIFLDNLYRLPISEVDRSNKRWLYTKKKRQDCRLSSALHKYTWPNEILNA